MGTSLGQAWSNTKHWFKKNFGSRKARERTAKAVGTGLLSSVGTALAPAIAPFVGTMGKEAQKAVIGVVHDGQKLVSEQLAPEAGKTVGEVASGAAQVGGSAVEGLFGDLNPYLLGGGVLAALLIIR